MIDVLSTPPSIKHAVLHLFSDQKSFPLYSRFVIKSASSKIFWTVSATWALTSKKLFWILGDAFTAFFTKFVNKDEFAFILFLISISLLICLLHKNIEF